MSFLPRTSSWLGLDALVGEVLGGVLGPEPEGVAGVADLRQRGVLEGLAGLRDDRLDHPLGVVHQPLLRAREDAPAPVEAVGLPGGLGDASTPGHLRDGGGAEIGHRAGGLPGRGVLDRDLLAGVREAVGGLRYCCSTVAISINLPFVSS